MQKQNIHQQYQILALVWFVLLFAQAMFFVVIYFSKPELFNFDFSQPLLGENPIMPPVFAILAITNFIISFVMTKRCNEQAIATQNTKYVQTGLVIGCAFCESISLLGMVLAFAFSYQYFFLWFILGIVGIILHFPKRRHLIDASYRK